MREQGKGKRFLRVSRYAKFSRFAHADSIQAGFELGHQQWIVRTASRDNQLSDFRFRRNKTMESIQNGERGQNRSGANYIFRIRASRLAVGEQSAQVCFAILLASR